MERNNTPTLDEMKLWDFVRLGSIEHCGVTIHRLANIHPHLYLGPAIGVDPGRKFGVAYLDGTTTLLYYGTLPKEPEQVNYGSVAKDLMEALFAFYPVNTRATIEGAAYSKNFGEANLAYIRMGFYLGLEAAGCECHMVPPSTIRKLAFGSAKIQADLDVWPSLNPHAADALGAALHCAHGMQPPEGLPDPLFPD